jgi:hypothetical protein
MPALQGCSALIDRVWRLLDRLVYNPAAEVLLGILAFLLISGSFEGGSDAPPHVSFSSAVALRSAATTFSQLWFFARVRRILCFRSRQPAGSLLAGCRRWLFQSGGRMVGSQ